MDRGPALKREALTWMLVSAASVFLCGSCLSIAGALLFYLAAQDADRGRFDEAGIRILWGKRITLLGILLGAIAGVILLVTRSMAGA